MHVYQSLVLFLVACFNFLSFLCWKVDEMKAVLLTNRPSFLVVLISYLNYFEQIDDLPTAAEVSKYAEGPSTPGLEEPNLFGTQMDQGNNEVDYHNSADLISLEATQKESLNHQRENDAIDCSLQNNGNHISLDLHHEDNACDLVEMDSKKEKQEHLACQAVMKDQENLIPNDHCLTSLPLVDSSNKDYPTTLLPECEGGMINASDVAEKEEDLQDGVLANNNLVSAPLANFVVSAPLMNNEKVASPSHVTSDQEDLSCKPLSNNMDESRGPGSDGHLQDGNTLSKHEVLNDIEISKSEGQSCLFDDAPVSNVISPLGSPGRPEVVDEEAQASQELKEAETLNHVSHEAVQPTESILRPCISHLGQPSLSFIEGIIEQINIS